MKNINRDHRHAINNHIVPTNPVVATAIASESSSITQHIVGEDGTDRCLCTNYGEKDNGERNLRSGRGWIWLAVSSKKPNKQRFKELNALTTTDNLLHLLLGDQLDGRQRTFRLENKTCFSRDLAHSLNTGC